MKLHTALYAGIVLLFLIGCADESPVAITDKAVYSEFTVVYDQSTDRTIGSATFWDGRKDAKQVIFNPDAQLFFQDVVMEYRSAGAFYTKDLSNYFATCSFKIIDINKKQFINSISVNKVEYPSSFDTLDITIPHTFTWTGPTLEAGEYITLRIGGKNFQQKTAGATSITLTVIELSGLSSLLNTATTATLERGKNVPLDPNEDLGGGGYIAYQYLAAGKEIFIR